MVAGAEPGIADADTDDFSIQDLFQRPIRDEDYSIIAVLQEWQAAAGLCLLCTANIITAIMVCGKERFDGCIDGCCRSGSDDAAGDPEKAQEKLRKQNHSNARSVISFVESCALFLWVLAMLKHSPQSVVFEVVIYFTFVSFLIIVQLRNRKLKDPEKLKKKELKPVSVYTDLEAGNPVEYLAVLFVQLMLYLLVAGAVYNQDKVKEFTFQQIVFYVCGALVSSVLRAREHSFYHTEYKPFWEPYCEECWEPKHKLNFRFRLFCSLLANEIFSQAVLILLPVVLMNAPDLMEFVKDATCVAFISQMDNLQNVADDQVMINENLERLKANQKLQEERLEANQKVQEQLKEIEAQLDKHALSLILKQLHEEQKKMRELMQQEKELKKELQALVEKEQAKQKALQEVVEKEQAKQKMLQEVVEKEQAKRKALQEVVEKEQAKQKELQHLMEKEQAKQKEFQEGVKNQLNTLTAALYVSVSRTSAAGDAPLPHSNFSPVSRSPAVPDAS